MVEFLVERGADVKAVNVFGRIPLHDACMEGRMVVVQYLADEHDTIHYMDEDGRTPLYYACRKGYLAIAKYLVKESVQQFSYQ